MTGTGKEQAGLSNLQLRIISSIVLGIIIVVLTWYGGFVFRLLCVVIAAAVLHEWLSMRPNLAKGQVLAAQTMLALVLALLLVGLPPLVILAAIGVCFAVTVMVGLITASGLWAGYGVLYAALPMAALAFLRGDSITGLWVIIYLFAVVWSTDILAYFSGRAIGGPKLAPSISPGKTRSGAIGGLVGAVVAGGIVAVIAWGGSAWLSACIIALMLSVVSQAGDLFESAVKRRHGVKDSSNLIPGHGGFMDRFDGLIFASVLLFMLLLAGSWTAATQTLFIP